MATEEDDESPYDGSIYRPPLPGTVRDALARAKRKRESVKEARKMYAEILSGWQDYSRRLTWVTVEELGR